MSRKYYTLLIRDAGKWSIHFGDFDRQVVLDEREDCRHGSNETKARDLKIIATTGKQVDIDAKVAELNTPNDRTTELSAVFDILGIPKPSDEPVDSLHGIAADAPVMLDCGEMIRTTWGEFIRDNADGIDSGDTDAETIARDLLKRPGCTAPMGGGASGEWSIRLLINE